MGIWCGKKKDANKGYSLVELIVVISIMVVMVGLISISISLMFSRDAEAVAKAIDDGLSETRMLSMSREGNFELVLHIDSTDASKNSIIINKDGSLYKPVNMKKGADIKVSGGGLAGTIPNASNKIVDVEIVFDKADGSVSTVDGEDCTGICLIEATATRLSTKKATVSLVAATGRHYVGK